MKARRLMALGAAVALMALSGCVRMHYDFVITPEDTVNGVILMSVLDQQIEADGYTREEVLSDLIPGENSSFPGEIVSEGVYEQDGYLGYQIEFSNSTLEEFSTGDELVITRQGDVFTFRADLGSGLGAEDLSQAQQESADARFSVTFPGEVLEHNGSEVVGNTVVWVLSPDSDPVMDAKGSAIPNGQAVPYVPGNVPDEVVPGQQTDPEQEPELEPDTPTTDPEEVNPRDPESPEIVTETGEATDDVTDTAGEDGRSDPAENPESDEANSSILLIGGLVAIAAAGGIGHAARRRRSAAAHSKAAEPDTPPPGQ